MPRRQRGAAAEAAERWVARRRDAGAGGGAGAGLVLEYATLAVAGCTGLAREGVAGRAPGGDAVRGPRPPPVRGVRRARRVRRRVRRVRARRAPAAARGVGMGEGEEGGGRMVVVEDPAAAFREALPAANAEMHAADEVDDSMSGTTAVAALVAGGAPRGQRGDSRAVAGVWREGRVAAEEPRGPDAVPRRRARPREGVRRAGDVGRAGGGRARPGGGGLGRRRGGPASRVGARRALPRHGLHAQPR